MVGLDCGEWLLKRNGEGKGNENEVGWGKWSKEINEKVGKGVGVVDGVGVWGKFLIGGYLGE